MRSWSTLILVVALLLGGCAKPAPVAPPKLGSIANAELDAVVCPPTDWRAKPLVRDDRSTHQTWVSPTGDTAYGVIRFSMPLPVGDDFALWGFLREMKKTEGEAVLLEKSNVREKRGLRFVAEGGLYRIRGIIDTRGFNGWVVYAGTLRVHPIRLDELELAVQARDNTAPGLGDRPHAEAADAPPELN
jgi:hypothetical protein